jgi:hypothetical protein
MLMLSADVVLLLARCPIFQHAVTHLLSAVALLLAAMSYLPAAVTHIQLWPMF